MKIYITIDNQLPDKFEWDKTTLWCDDPDVSDIRLMAEELKGFIIYKMLNQKKFTISFDFVSHDTRNNEGRKWVQY